MSDEVRPGPRAPAAFREYLRVLAGARFPAKLRSRLDPSDIVQKTLVKAHQNLAGFRGQTDAAMAAWLRRILTNVLIEELRRAAAAARDVEMERSIGPALEDSSARLEAWLADGGSSPEERASRNEDLCRLAEALARLPEAQRQAIELQQLGGYSVKAVARQMGRTTTAVGGLLRHGMHTLRQAMQEGDP